MLAIEIIDLKKLLSEKKQAQKKNKAKVNQGGVISQSALRFIYRRNTVEGFNIFY